MKIGIIGAGSIGLLFAFYLGNKFEVTLYTRTSEQANVLNQKGLICIKGPNQSRVPCHALPISEYAGTDEITIITVKHYQLDSVINKLNQYSGISKNLLFLQNGMGHLKLLENLKVDNIYVGSVEHGALKINPNTVSHNGTGAINVSVYKGDADLLRVFAHSTPDEFSITEIKEYDLMLINKLIANAVINPLTAILHVTNGELIRNPFYFKVLKNLFNEITYILNLENPDEHWENIIKICEKTADNRSSMLKDIEAGRETEVDAILGYILDEAKRQKKKTTIQTENLYFLVKGKEMKRGDYL